MSKAAILPSRMYLLRSLVLIKCLIFCRNLQLFKGKKVGAKKGYDLLKKKSDALKKAFRDILIRILDTKKKMGKEFNEALFALAEANFAAGDFSRNVMDSVKTKTNV